MSKPLTKTQIKKLKADLNSPLDFVPAEIIFILQDIDDPVNVGSIFRTADGLEARLILTGKTPTPPHAQISQTARGLERTVDWDYVADFTHAITKLRQAGFQIVGIELTPDAQPYFNFTFGTKVALVLGNEALGIYKKHLALCDAHVFIPMLGKGPSLNVNVAAAIVGYQVLSYNR